VIVVPDTVPTTLMLPSFELLMNTVTVVVPGGRSVAPSIVHVTIVPTSSAYLFALYFVSVGQSSAPGACPAAAGPAIAPMMAITATNAAGNEIARRLRRAREPIVRPPQLRAQPDDTSPQVDNDGDAEWDY
jgi:hypothetical protein